MATDEWQDAPTRIGPKRARHAAPPGWLLLAASFLAGVAIASAAFVATWRHEAAQSTDAQARLSAVQASLGIAHAKNAKLAKQARADAQALKQVRARAAAAERERKATAAQLGAVGHRLAGVVHRLAAAPAALHTVRSSGDALASTATTLANDVLGLSTYLSQTQASQLDPNYIATQLDYLKKLAAKLTAGAPTLSADLADLEQAITAAQKQAGAG